MARDKGKAPRSVKVEDTDEPKVTVTGTGKDFGRAAVGKMTGADDPKIGGPLQPGAKYSPRGANVGGVQKVGNPEDCMRRGRDGDTDF